MGQRYLVQKRDSLNIMIESRGERNAIHMFESWGCGIECSVVSVFVCLFGVSVLLCFVLFIPGSVIFPHQIIKETWQRYNLIVNKCNTPVKHLVLAKCSLFYTYYKR